jgi:hypothetical protein
MATVEFEYREPEEERVIDWRAGALLRAGYENTTALELALRSDVDLHFAVDLVRHGCPPRTAARILL